jgi:tight adherence protein B
MKRFAILVVLLGVLPGITGGARAADRISLTPLRAEHFPTRAYVLTVPPGIVPRPGQVHVTENGVGVNGLSVAPAATDVQHHLGEVLLIDTSASMRGAPITAAISAARAFAARRAQGQPLAVIAFNNQTRVVLPFTTNESQIQSALSTTPATGSGTHIYDAVAMALGIVKRQNLAGASIVLLSDGADVGSTAVAPQVLNRSRPLHVRVYAVGLRSAHFQPGTLHGLAAGTLGMYTETGSTQRLKGIFAALGSRLSNEYVLRYRSFATPLSHVNVTTSVDGLSVTATAGYEAPALAVGAGVLRTHRGWASSAAVLALAVAIALMLGVALVLALRTRIATVQDRVVPYVEGLGPSALAVDVDEAELGPPEAVSLLRSKRWWREFCETVEIGRTRFSPAQIVAGTALLTVVAIWILVSVSGHPLLGLIGFAVPFVAYQWVQWMARKQRFLFAEQLADNLQIVASALRSGHGFVGALGEIVNDASEPSRAEFRRVLAEEQLGTPLEEALTIAVDRMNSVDLNQVALVASVQRETGGNAAEVLDRVVDSIRERLALRRLISTLTAQGRLSGGVVSALPIALLIAISIINPEFTRPLYNTTTGNIILALAACLVVTGWLWIRRIVTFEL